MRAALPTRALALLLAIGIIDLIVTATLYARGLIEERNPLMAGLLAHSEWSFILVKAATLVFAWRVLSRHAKFDLRFVRRISLCASGAYLAILALAFFCP